jgi:hypothetical protein
LLAWLAFFLPPSHCSSEFPLKVLVKVPQEGHLGEGSLAEPKDNEISRALVLVHLAQRVKRLLLQLLRLHR